MTKMFDIFIMAVYYFIFGSIISIIVDKIMIDRSDKELEEISSALLLADIIFTFGMLGIGFYSIRVIVKQIPYPFDHRFGYDHSKLKEAATGGVIIAYIIFTYQKKLIKKLNELKRRYNI